MLYLRGVKDLVCTGFELSLFECNFTIEIRSVSIDSLPILDCPSEFISVTLISSKGMQLHHYIFVLHQSHSSMPGMLCVMHMYWVSTYAICTVLEDVQCRSMIAEHAIKQNIRNRLPNMVCAINRGRF